MKLQLLLQTIFIYLILILNCVELKKQLPSANNKILFKQDSALKSNSKKKSK